MKGSRKVNRNLDHYNLDIYYVQIFCFHIIQPKGYSLG